MVHVVAVSFAAYSLWLSLKPPDRSHPYGHDKISFFSSGFEGAMIVMAAFCIIFASIQKWMAGLRPCIPRIHKKGRGESTRPILGRAGRPCCAGTFSLTLPYS